MLDDYSLWSSKDNAGTFLVGPGGATYLTGDLVAYYKAKGMTKYVDGSSGANEAHAAYSRQSGLTP